MHNAICLERRARLEASDWKLVSNVEVGMWACELGTRTEGKSMHVCRTHISHACQHLQNLERTFSELVHTRPCDALPNNRWGKSQRQAEGSKVTAPGQRAHLRMTLSLQGLKPSLVCVTLHSLRMGFLFSSFKATGVQVSGSFATCV